MKNSVSIWYAVFLSVTLTSCFQTKDGKATKLTEPEKPIVVPQLNPKEQTTAEKTPTHSVPTVQPKTEGEVSKDQSKLACIHSVCGTEYVLAPEYNKHPEVLDKNLKVIEDKLGRSIELKMGQTIKNHMIAGDVLKAITPDQISGIQFASEQIGFLNAFKYLGQIKSYYSSLEYDAKGKVVFNTEKLKKNNPSLNEKEIEAISSLSVIFQTGDYQQVDALTYKFSMERLNRLYFMNTQNPAAGELNVLKYTAELINNMRLNVFSRIFIKELLANEIQSVVDKAIAKEELSMKEKLDLVKKYGSYLFINILVTDEKIQSTFSKLPFDGTSVLAGINKNFKNTFHDTFMDKAAFKSSYAAELLACKQDLAQSLAETPTAQEVKKAEAMMSLVAEKANAVVNRKSLQSSALAVEFIMPKNQEEVLKDWEEKFSVSLKQSELIQATIKNLKSEDIDGKFVTTLAVLYNKTDSSMFEGVRSDCKTEEPSFLSDAALPSDKKFRASSVVVKNIDAALGVVAHEIGHIVQYYKADLFKNELSCLEGNYGSKQYLGEDFADLFSSKVMVELYGEKKITTNKNMICTFPEFKKLKLDEINIANASKNDEHSSALYRLLAVSAATDASTSQCTSYLTKYEPQTKVFNNYCKWQE